MALALQVIYSEEEYLRLENDALEKSEYFLAKIVMMAGDAESQSRDGTLPTSLAPRR